MKPEENWRKSSYSADIGNCIEVGQSSLEVTVIRDSKNFTPVYLPVGSVSWRKFVERIKNE
jgi:Domain of unknown function (DUF397)